MAIDASRCSLAPPKNDCNKGIAIPPRTLSITNEGLLNNNPIFPNNPVVEFPDVVVVVLPVVELLPV